MGEPSCAYRLLSLFTSADFASSIEGDLLELRRIHGKTWFAVNVLTTAFALWRQAIARELPRAMALGAIAVALSLLLCAFLEAALAEATSFAPSAVLVLSMIAAFAFLLGAGLVGAAPRAGVLGVTAASLALLALFLGSQITARTELLLGGTPENVVVAAASTLALLLRDVTLASLLYLVPLNAGSALVHWSRRRKSGDPL